MITKYLFLEEIGKAFIPKRILKHTIRPLFRKYMQRAGISEVPYKLFGTLFWLTFLVTAIVYIFKLYPYIIEKELSSITFFLTVFFYWFIFQGILVILLIFAIYLYFEMKIYNRTVKIEAVLQDFLRFVSENLKGGMSFESALWGAIKPEFGVLAVEVRLAAKKVMTGTDVDDALNEFTGKYDSPMLKRSFDLIIEGLKGGGKIAHLIDKIVDNLEETKHLKAELAATNLTYVIFISFVAIAIAPLLFALATQFLTVITGFSEQVGGLGIQSATTQMPLMMGFGEMSVKPEDFIIFSKYAIGTTAFFSSIIVALISKGSIKESVKYIPFYVAGALIMHRILVALFNIFFGGLFSF